MLLTGWDVIDNDEETQSVEAKVFKRVKPKSNQWNLYFIVLHKFKRSKKAIKSFSDSQCFQRLFILGRSRIFPGFWLSLYYFLAQKFMFKALAGWQSLLRFDNQHLSHQIHCIRVKIFVFRLVKVYLTIFVVFVHFLCFLTFK